MLTKHSEKITLENLRIFIIKNTEDIESIFDQYLISDQIESKYYELCDFDKQSMVIITEKDSIITGREYIYVKINAKYNEDTEDHDYLGYLNLKTDMKEIDFYKYIVNGNVKMINNFTINDDSYCDIILYNYFEPGLIKEKYPDISSSEEENLFEPFYDEIIKNKSHFLKYGKKKSNCHKYKCIISFDIINPCFRKMITGYSELRNAELKIFKYIPKKLSIDSIITKEIFEECKILAEDTKFILNDFDYSFVSNDIFNFNADKEYIEVFVECGYRTEHPELFIKDFYNDCQTMIITEDYDLFINKNKLMVPVVMTETDKEKIDKNVDKFFIVDGCIVLYGLITADIIM